MSRHSLYLFLSLALLASPARAASFDCARAAQPDERAICANPDLSALDSEMGGLWFAFSRVPMFMGSNGARMDDAQAFLRLRAACGASVACLRPLYRARIETLKQAIVRAMADYARLRNADPPQ
ncbi:MAG: lysozyme inhibitor LprI family protein [Parvibaculaceae bacterium]